MPDNVPSLVDTLIIICCHAIFLGGSDQTDPANESNWLIEPFQFGETSTFIKHVEEGVRQLVLSKGKALLVFSGGATKQRQIRELRASGKNASSVDEGRTEAQSYYDVAKFYNFFGYSDAFGHGKSLQHHICLDPFAADSYQNVLLPLIQWPIFQRLHSSSGQELTLPLCATPLSQISLATGEHLTLDQPRNVVIISHEFKRARFLELHVPAVANVMSSWLSGRDEDGNGADKHASRSAAPLEFTFIGINPPFDEVKIREIEEGDRKKGYGVWQDDVYGASELLVGKRLQRGWEEAAFIDVVARWFGRGTTGVMTSIVRGVARGKEQ